MTHIVVLPTVGKVKGNCSVNLQLSGVIRHCSQFRRKSSSFRQSVGLVDPAYPVVVMPKINDLACGFKSPRKQIRCCQWLRRREGSLDQEQSVLAGTSTRHVGTIHSQRCNRDSLSPDPDNRPFRLLSERAGLLRLSWWARSPGAVDPASLPKTAGAMLTLLRLPLLPVLRVANGFRGSRFSWYALSRLIERNDPPFPIP